MIVCESYPESAIQSRSCKIVDCVVGKDVVKDTASDLRAKLKIQGILWKTSYNFVLGYPPMYRMIYSDNLFLDRYAQTTTNNGEVIDESGQGQGKQLNCLGIPVVWIFDLFGLWTKVRRFRLSDDKGYGFWAKMTLNIYWTTDHQDKEEMKHSKNLVSTLLKIFELVVMLNCLIIQGAFLNLKLFGFSVRDFRVHSDSESQRLWVRARIWFWEWLKVSIRSLILSKPILVHLLCP